ncbi:MAG: hypothetical protein ABIQ15_17320 [Nocardioides sp.]
MTDVTDEKKTTKRAMSPNVPELRGWVAQGVWWLALAFALLLVVAALLVALGGNDGNDLVDFVKRYADKVDLGVFDRQNGVFDFDGKNRQTKNAVVNWGLGAVAWLVIGKVVSGIIRK